MRILIGESDRATAHLYLNTWKEQKIKGAVKILTDGVQVMDYLKRWGDFNADNAPRPDMMILDMDLRDMPAKEIMDDIAGDEEVSEIPIVITTRRPHPAAIEKIKKMGAIKVLVTPDSKGKVAKLFAHMSDYLD